MDTKFIKIKDGFIIKKRNSRVFIAERENLFLILFIRVLDSNENVNITNNETQWVVERIKIKMLYTKIVIGKVGAEEFVKAMVMLLYGTDGDIIFRKHVDELPNKEQKDKRSDARKAS